MVDNLLTRSTKLEERISFRLRSESRPNGHLTLCFEDREDVVPFRVLVMGRDIDEGRISLQPQTLERMAAHLRDLGGAEGDLRPVCAVHGYRPEEELVVIPRSPTSDRRPGLEVIA